MSATEKRRSSTERRRASMRSGRARSAGVVARDRSMTRVIAYLAVMCGAAGASSLITQTSKVVGQNVGKKVAGQALTKTTWYPLVKKIGALLGQKITKKTVEKDH